MIIVRIQDLLSSGFCCHSLNSLIQDAEQCVLQPGLSFFLHNVSENRSHEQLIHTADLSQTQIFAPANATKVGSK